VTSKTPSETMLETSEEFPEAMKKIQEYTETIIAKEKEFILAKNVTEFLTEDTIQSFATLWLTHAYATIPELHTRDTVMLMKLMQSNEVMH